MDSSQFLPKPWLLQSFFSGYELLSDAFSVDWDLTVNMNTEENPAMLRLLNNEQQQSIVLDNNIGYSVVNFDFLSGLDPTEHLADIDDEEATEKVSLESANAKASVKININLPFPPKHLRDVNIHAIHLLANNNSSSETASDDIVPDSIPVSDSIMHSYDPEAYVLLCKLVDILDHAADDDTKDTSGLSEIEALESLSITQLHPVDIFADNTIFSIDCPSLSLNEDDLLSFSNEMADNGFHADSSNLLAQGRLTYIDDASLLNDINAAKEHAYNSRFDHRHNQRDDDNSDLDKEVEKTKHINNVANHARNVQVLLSETDELLVQGIKSTLPSASVAVSVATATATTAIASDNNTSNTTTFDVDTASQSTVCHPSKYFIEALVLLRSSVCQAVTGVVLTDTGIVERCVDVVALPNVTSSDGGDDEGDWEDCDDDEEDEGDDNDNDNDDAEESNDNNDLETNNNSLLLIDSIMKSRNVSFALQARLLSICSSIAYLAGDSTGAVKCLRAALQAARNAAALVTVVTTGITSLGETNTSLGNELAMQPWAFTRASNESMIADTLVKLASLLTDMDEVKEVTSMVTLLLVVDYYYLFAFINVSFLCCYCLYAGESIVY